MYFCKQSLLSQVRNHQNWEGDWFSHPEKRGLGTAYYHLRLEKNGIFHMHRLLFHPNLNNEEARYEGVWDKKEDSILIQIQNCSYYTNQSLSHRWALLRKFDCDHMKMEFTIQESSSNKGQKEAVLNPNEYGKEDKTIFFHRNQPTQSMRWFRIFSVENKIYAWGIGVQNIRGKKNGEIWRGTKKLAVVYLKPITESSIEMNIENYIPQIEDFLGIQR